MKKVIGLCISLILVFSVLASIDVISAGRPENVPPPLEKRIFIHYKEGFGKPEGTPGKGPPSQPPGEEGHSDHYKLLGRGVEWKTTAEFVIDPDDSGLPETFIIDAVTISAEEWDDGAYSGWGGVTPNLFKYNGIAHDATFDTETRDGRNSVLFGDYPTSGVIAVTVVWGYFGGPPKQREIVEFDMMFDTDFVWGDASEGAVVMDFQNIATHELGHAAGLDDYYQCDLETMYGYSYSGDTVKRDLYDGDIAGIKQLYG